MLGAVTRINHACTEFIPSERETWFAASASPSGHQCRTKKERHHQKRNASGRPLSQHAIDLLDQPAKGKVTPSSGTERRDEDDHPKGRAMLISAPQRERER